MTTARYGLVSTVGHWAALAAVGLLLAFVVAALATLGGFGALASGCLLVGFIARLALQYPRRHRPPP